MNILNIGFLFADHRRCAFIVVDLRWDAISPARSTSCSEACGHDTLSVSLCFLLFAFFPLQLIALPPVRCCHSSSCVWPVDVSLPRVMLKFCVLPVPVLFSRTCRDVYVGSFFAHVWTRFVCLCYFVLYVVYLSVCGTGAQPTQTA